MIGTKEPRNDLEIKVSCHNGTANISWNPIINKNIIDIVDITIEYNCYDNDHKNTDIVSCNSYIVYL